MSRTFQVIRLKDIYSVIDFQCNNMEIPSKMMVHPVKKGINK